jgi:hypothetical protein
MIFRSSICLILVVLSFLAAIFLPTYAASYSMRYDLTYTGVPFAGGAIVLTSNFTNTGQLSIRVTSISFTSDFWSNGTRLVTSGLLFNLTAGTSREFDTPVAIPASASIGNHIVTATGYWQYSNSTGWFNASPIVTSTSVGVSQTIGSLFASFAIVFITGLVVAGIIVLIALVVVFKKKKSKPTGLPKTPSQ